MEFDITSFLIGKASGSGGGSTDPRTLLASWDFTGNSPLVDSVSGKILENYNNSISFSAAGAYYNANREIGQGLGDNQRLQISIGDLLGPDGSLAGCDVEVDTGQFTRYEIGIQYALRFVMVSDLNGFAYRQARESTVSGWNFYNAAWGNNYNLNPSIAYATVKVSIAEDSSEHDIVYINGFPFIESTVDSLATVAEYINIGAVGAADNINTCVGGLYVRAMRVYRR